jgi:hypothetical protein
MMLINGYNFKIGADPEVFVTYNGKLTSAYGLVPGTKENPFPVENGFLQVDGMALEFNINPATDFKSFDRNLNSVLSQMIKAVPGYEILVEPVADFGLDYLREQPKEASDLGCNPDFNAYTRGMNPSPNVNTPFRTASGHIHIGWQDEPVDVNDPSHLEACYALVKVLDIYLGIPSLFWDTDRRRRELYGKAGSFRPKPYGLEYRTLSNKWVGDSNLHKLIYENTIAAIIQTWKDPDFGDTLFRGLSARDIIDHWSGKITPNQTSCYEEALSSIIKEYTFLFPKDFV